MKRELSSVHLALILILSCVVFRLISSVFPEYIPNVSPLMSIAFVGAMYLPGRWGWLVGPATLIFTDLAFINVNYKTDGAMVSWWSLVSLGVYALAGVLGAWIASRKTLVKIVSGSIACSLLFYVAANTFSWWNNMALKMDPSYSPTLAGWWQANTVGLPGYVPTWLFLRNGMAGDLFFVLLLLLVLDRGLLLGQAPAKMTPRAA